MRRSTWAALALACLPLVPACAGPPTDPLADALTRWRDFGATDSSKDEMSRQVHAAAGPAIEDAERARAAGYRDYALLRLSAAWPLLGGLEWLHDHASDAASMAAFTPAWKRAAADLAPTPARVPASPGLHPAMVGAVAEAAQPQPRILYDASMDYAVSTDAAQGVFYVGEAYAQREFVELARRMASRGVGHEPAFRSVAPELDQLEREMLAAYHPPLSVDHHGDFIRAHSALKEARELDAAGLHRGALLRLLQADLRFQPMRGRPPVFDAAATPGALDRLAARIDAPGTDHSIGRAFLEAARIDLADTAASATHATAAAIADDVLPRYFSALEPAPPARPRPAASVTVTLVRWPYT